LFLNEEGLPITEYLPEDHEGREIYGLVKDPHPDKGRALRHKAGMSEEEAAEATEEAIPE
jgi:ferredoxin-thioredoxin reductase catalytic chain